MKKNMIVVIAILLLVSLVISSCQTDSTTTGSVVNQTTTGQGASSSTTQTTVNSEVKQKLSITVEAHTFIEDYNTNAFTIMLEDTLGVDLNFELWSEPKTKLSLLIGSNTELTDIICFALDDTAIYSYGSSGVFIPLNDYFADPELARNFSTLNPEKQDIILKNTRFADGNNYSMPRLGEYFPNNINHYILINKVWLEKLNKEIPATTEEFYDILKLFSENDMNENGIDDEIPMISSATGWGANVAAVLLNSFVSANNRSNYLYVENGVIKASYIMDEFREGLTYVHSLVKDGLLDPVSFTQTQDQLKAIVNQDIAIAGVIQIGGHGQAFNKPAGVEPSYDLQYDHPIASQYAFMETPTGPDGQSYTIYGATNPTQLFFITEYCKTPELAFRLGDIGYDPYNSLISRHGTEGENWTKDPDILKNYKAATIGGVIQPVDWVLLDDPWGRAQNKHWQQTFPGHFPFEFNLRRGQKLDAKKSTMEIIYDMYQDNVPNEYIGRLAYTSEELEELGFLQTAINEYVIESIASFATGNKDIEKDWDRYINDLNSMDLERYIKIVQNGYDRSNK